MTVAVADAAAFTAKVSAAQARLERAAVAAGMDGDPMGEVILALGEVLEVLADGARLGEAQRHPLTDAERAALLRATETAAAVAVRKAAVSIVGASNRRTTLLAALIGGGLLLAAAGGGYMAGWAAAERQAEAPAVMPRR